MEIMASPEHPNLRKFLVDQDNRKLSDLPNFNFLPIVSFEGNIIPRHSEIKSC